MKLINQSEHSVKLSHIIVEGLPVPQRANVNNNNGIYIALIHRCSKRFRSCKSVVFANLFIKNVDFFPQCNITLLLRGVIFKFR